MTYRLYRAEDFAELYAIEEVCFQPPLRFTRRYLRQIIQSPTSATWIAQSESQLAGFAVAECAVEQGTIAAYIQTIEVLPEFRRGGVGIELLRRLEASVVTAGATVIWLHVDEENASAIRLYRSHGYERRGRQEDYYGRARNAEIYVKPLPVIPAERTV